MRIAHYLLDGTARLDQVLEDEIVTLDLPAGTRREIADTYGSAALRDAPPLRGGTVSRHEMVLLPPVPYPPRNVFAVGWNYLEHLAEGAGLRGDDVREIPEHPAFFTKPSATLVGGGAPLGGQWFEGDGSCPFGPWLVTADELRDPQRTELLSSVNGELRQHASTAGMACPVAWVIAELSRGLTLLPGDLIRTDTPSGVGYARGPACFLADGDEVTVSQIGELTNPVRHTDLTSYRARSGAGV